MDKYPSIPSRLPDKYFGKEFYWFPKYDGQNFRAEWNNKKGWYKFGSKNQLIDRTDKYWGPVIELFMKNVGENFGHNLGVSGHTRAIAFYEYYGESSLAGHHREGDEMRFELIDIKRDKKGFDRPETYISHLAFDGEPIIAKYTEDLIQSVRDYRLETANYELNPVHTVCTFEGVVGKRMEGSQLIMVKLKTNAWREEIKATFGDAAHVYLES